MLHVQRASYSAVLLMTALVFVSGCGEPAAPPPGAPDEARAPTIDQGTESEPDESKTGGTETATGDPSSGASAGEWGTLTGRIVFDGQPPAPQPIDTSKDPNCKVKLATENILVGDNGGLANAVVMLRTKDVPVNPEYEKTAGAKIDLTNKNCRFEPHVQIVRLSQELLLKNDDPTGHNTNVSPLQPRNPAINPILAMGGDPTPYQFSAEEAVPVPVKCNIHPWMSAWIVARKDPYAAVTDKDGKFTIHDLPAGRELEFRLWHESPGYLKNATFKGGKADNRGTFKIKLKPGTNDLGDIKVSGSIFKR
ncbi:MAG: hypothetical protein WD063_18110 [Pirellulales bacterium]